jgi:hypothetical protein
MAGHFRTDDFFRAIIVAAYCLILAHPGLAFDGLETRNLSVGETAQINNDKSSASTPANVGA